MDKDIKEQQTAEESDDTPLGAIVITTILAVFILVTWFSMYILNFLRS